MTPDLTRLAEMCEGAEGPSYDLEKKIAEAVGYPAIVPPAYTASLDAAVTLVPEGWYWRAGHGVLWAGWAHLNRKHSDHCDRDDEHSAHAETPALALCTASLRARATLAQAGEGRGGR